MVFQLPVLLREPGVTVVISPVSISLSVAFEQLSFLLSQHAGETLIRVSVPHRQQMFILSQQISTKKLLLSMQLIALAKDQVEKCQECDVDAEIWNSNLSEAKREALVREMCCDEPTLRLLYVTPGASKAFMSLTTHGHNHAGHAQR